MCGRWHEVGPSRLSGEGSIPECVLRILVKGVLPILDELVPFGSPYMDNWAHEVSNSSDQDRGAMAVLIGADGANVESSNSATDLGDLAQVGPSGLPSDVSAGQGMVARNVHDDLITGKAIDRFDVHRCVGAVVTRKHVFELIS